MVGDLVRVYIFYTKEQLGFSEMFDAKILHCPEIHIVFVTNICAMFGHEDAPIDDIVFGVSEIAKYGFANHIMILRDIFAGRDVQHMDFNRFTIMSAPLVQMYGECVSTLSRKVPPHVAESIINRIVPGWMLFNHHVNVITDNDFGEIMADAFDKENMLSSTPLGEYVRVKLSLV